ncbi:MAG TPA: T9SS type A sorting domain-containing protein [Bacteroidia bacterium]
MKKLVCIVLLTIAGLSAKAQVPNSGFEDLNQNNNTSHWGEAHLLVFWVDTNGVFHGDSIMYDEPYGRLYFPTTDAYQGNFALELRNAFNYTSNQPMVGRAAVNQDESDYSAFGGPWIPVTTQPTELSFYYKFFPQNGDVGSASLIVNDSNGTQIGSAVIDITTAASSYTYISTPVVYTESSPAAFITLEFRNSKDGTPVTFGTRMQIDEVDLHAVGLKPVSMDESLFSCYPVPATDNLSIKTKTTIEEAEIEIYDPSGKLVLTKKHVFGESMQLDVSALEEGVYILKINRGKEVVTKRFVKQ